VAILTALFFEEMPWQRRRRAKADVAESVGSVH
jgi:alpha-1,6-mannosyltransferase